VTDEWDVGSTFRAWTPSPFENRPLRTEHALLGWNQQILSDVRLPGVSEVALGGFTSATSSLIEGEEYGVFFGNRWARESFQDPSESQTVGNNGLILDANGFPVDAATQGKIGNPNPDWRANIGNTLRYGDLSLRFLFDFKIGGEVWNGTKGALKFFGRLEEQAQTTTVSAEKAENLPTFSGSTIADLAPAAGDIQQNEDGSCTFRGEVRDFGRQTCWSASSKRSAGGRK
jgi:hypothetical protein